MRLLVRLADDRIHLFYELLSDVPGFRLGQVNSVFCLVVMILCKANPVILPDWKSFMHHVP